MTSNWKECKLDEIIIINPTETLRKGDVAKKVAMEKLLPFCRDIPNYEFQEYNGGTKFRNGDTIMARITPCLENGKISQVRILDNNEIGFGSTEYIIFRAKEGITDSDFIYYLVTSSIIREPAIKSMVGSSGRQRVQTDVVKQIEVKLPPLDIQQKIAKVLSAIDDKIELNNLINNNLEQQAQAIFKSWFVDFEPFGGTMPNDWCNGNLADIAKDIICGKTPSTAKKEYYGNDIPFITIPDMHNNTYIIKTERYLSALGAESQINKLLPANSICVSCIATAGLVSLTSMNSQTNQQINSIIPKKEVSPYYVYMLLKSLSEKIIMLGSSGSTTCNLNKGQFAKIEIIIPSQQILDKFNELVKFLFEQIKNLQIENQQLVQLRDTLLPKLMSGEIDVSDIEIDEFLENNSADKLSFSEDK